MQHSNCYSNVKSQYNKFEYGGYLIVKMDLVYKWPFSFFFLSKFPTPFSPILFQPPSCLVLRNVPTPAYYNPPFIPDPRVCT